MTGSTDDGDGAQPEDEQARQGAMHGGLAHGKVSRTGHANGAHRPGPWLSRRRDYGNQSTYAALDLGTNNCRLLVARPTRRGFHVIDAFSRIIRLGEGVSSTGRLSDSAIHRTIEALKVCAAKMRRHDVGRSRLVATEACRVAANGGDFLRRVEQELGLRIELLSREAEAHLAVSGCASLIDPDSEWALVFDIGGGSSEIIWLDLRKAGKRTGPGAGSHDTITKSIAAWTSLPVGVVTLAEKFGGKFVCENVFEAMVGHVLTLLEPFERDNAFAGRLSNGSSHLLGTSGTVTTVAGVHLGLKRYERSRVDGCWLTTHNVRNVTGDLLRQSYEERINQPCIGKDRADLVLAGCAILEALLRLWPCERLRVADRGLREGILTMLMSEDGHHRSRPRRGQDVD